MRVVSRILLTVLAAAGGVPCAAVLLYGMAYAVVLASRVV